ncbi:c-type cytochrome domain-containing protein [Haliangium ochraceum]|nr:c-type cytochrome domain-containing protein [Haliangium ochraceum]
MNPVPRPPPHRLALPARALPACAVPVLALIALGSLSACILDPLAPEVGEELASDCDNADSDPDTPVQYSSDIVQRIFERDEVGCLFCHAPDADIPIGFQQSQLDVSSYESLRQGGLISRTGIVVPGRPCDSILLQKVSEVPPYGQRMPFNGPPFLAEQEIQLIHDWIAEGAQNN